MKIVVDTNVFLSGVFFSGPPHDILRAWREGHLILILSPEILAEYQEAGNELACKYPEVDIAPWIALVMAHGTLVESPPLSLQVCTDPDDDKFLACAIASGAELVVSGDKALLATSGYKGVTVLKPRQVVDRYLGDECT
jgi:putative PIN family toxin of toxin-antitoxin system